MKPSPSLRLNEISTENIKERHILAILSHDGLKTLKTVVAWKFKVDQAGLQLQLRVNEGYLVISIVMQEHRYG